MAERAPVVVLGAEQQAATSLALAYPERSFLFVSDCPVVDGWDLPNVRILHAVPEAAMKSFGGVAPDEVVPLSSRWLPACEVTVLSEALPRIEAALPGITLPVTAEPRFPALQVKGDRWHRPDSPLGGTAEELSGVADTQGCGLVYQDKLEARHSVMALGRRDADGRIAMGLFRIFKERFFRIDVLQAAESIDDPALRALSRAALDALAFEGWFSLNWLSTAAGPRLSSFRPVAKAAFGCFRRAGLDLMAPLPRNGTLAAGLRLVAMPHYASFDWTRPQ